MTFVVEDLHLNVTNLVQWQSTRRTIEEAWEDCRANLYRRAGMDPVNEPWSSRFHKTWVIDGLAQTLNPNEPLRRATPEELKALQEVRA